MSVLCRRRQVSEGDLVIVYEGHNSVSPLRIESGKTFQNKFGAFKHADLLGLEYGTKVYGKGKNPGWIQILHPTPDLWTLALPHRTQILYHADISLILLHLDLRPGAVVVESGTGSASLSTSIARTIAPHGHLYTFEFNKDRVLKAREDFKRTGVEPVVTIRHRDVCAKGFPVIGGGVDAVFLDLPTPWEVVPSAQRILRSQGMICSFSPCIEQVQKTCAALRDHHFTDIRTFETLLRDYDVAPLSLPVPDFGSAPATLTSPPDVPVPVPDGNASSSGAGAEEDGARGQKRPRSPGGAEEKAGEVAVARGEGATKRARTEEKGKADFSGAPLGSRPFAQQRGHTGYLTFARRWIRWTEADGFTAEKASSAPAS